MGLLYFVFVSRLRVHPNELCGSISGTDVCPLKCCRTKLRMKDFTHKISIPQIKHFAFYEQNKNIFSILVVS